MLVILVPLLFLRPILFSFAAGILLIGGMIEVSLLKRHEWRVLFLGILPLSLAVYIGGLVFYYTGLEAALLSVMLAGAVAAVLTFFTRRKERQWPFFLATAFYISAGFLAIAVLRDIWLWLILVLFIVFVTDTFAYFTGFAVGRHRLAPSISPKKTIEGAIGGAAFAVLGGLLLTRIFGIFLFTSWPWFVFFLLLLSLAAQLGDLLASAIKRAYGVKDFSNVFPGHGGLLDRFDSLLAASIVLILIFFSIGVF